MRTPRRSLATTAVLLLAASTSWAAAPAHADGPQAPAASPEQLLMVMDSSGSMAEPTGDGTSRIDAAKQALNTVIDETPDDLHMGLRVYGASVFDKSEPGACTDSDLVVPIGADNRDQLRTEVDQYRPYGETPIAHSLEQAGNDLADQGERTIVLVSDGEETCVPDPCPVATELANKGIEVTVNVVGLNVTGTAKEQLQCIADEGNGEYFDATNATELTDAMNQATTRSGQAFEVEGEPIDGAAAQADAPTIGEGVYAEEFTTEEKWYRVELPTPESTVWAGVATQAEHEDSGTTHLNVSVFEPGEESFNCGSDYDYSGGDQGASIFGAAAHSEDCDPGTEVFVKAKAELKNDAPLPVRLKIVIEPAVSDPESLPGEADHPTWPDLPVEKVEGEPVSGASSFGEAPVIEAGAQPITLVGGETQIFAVELDWGQQLQSQVTMNAVDELVDGSPSWFIEAYSPFGSKVGAFQVPGAPPRYHLGTAHEDVTLGTTTPELRHQNRTSSKSARGDMSLPGRYYVIVSSGALSTATDVSQEFTGTLQTQVIGDAGAGAPDYVEAEASPSPQPTPSQDDEGASEGTGTPSPEPGGSGAGSGGASGVADDGPSWGLIGGLGGGAVVLAGIGGGLIWFLRRT